MFKRVFFKDGSYQQIENGCEIDVSDDRVVDHNGNPFYTLTVSNEKKISLSKLEDVGGINTIAGEIVLCDCKTPEEAVGRLKPYIERFNKLKCEKTIEIYLNKYSYSIINPDKTGDKYVTNPTVTAGSYCTYKVEVPATWKVRDLLKKGQGFDYVYRGIELRYMYGNFLGKYDERTDRYIQQNGNRYVHLKSYIRPDIYSRNNEVVLNEPEKYAAIAGGLSDHVSTVIDKSVMVFKCDLTDRVVPSSIATNSVYVENSEWCDLDEDLIEGKIYCCPQFDDKHIINVVVKNVLNNGSSVSYTVKDSSYYVNNAHLYNMKKFLDAAVISVIDSSNKNKLTYVDGSIEDFNAIYDNKLDTLRSSKLTLDQNNFKLYYNGKPVSETDQFDENEVDHTVTVELVYKTYDPKIKLRVVLPDGEGEINETLRVVDDLGGSVTVNTKEFLTKHGVDCAKYDENGEPIDSLFLYTDAELTHSQGPISNYTMFSPSGDADGKVNENDEYEYVFYLGWYGQYIG